MRIISGKFKSRRIVLPKGVETRPTTDRTKESVFNMLDVRKGIADISVLDLFSGSGSLAFEAISRGATKAVCIENNKKCVVAISSFAKQLGISAQLNVVQGDVWSYLNGFSTPYDVIFADPPYDYAYMTELPDLVLEKGWLKKDGWFVLEHDSRHNFTDHPHCVFAKPYGRTIVTIFLAERIAEESKKVEHDIEE